MYECIERDALLKKERELFISNWQGSPSRRAIMVEDVLNAPTADVI